MVKGQVNLTLRLIRHFLPNDTTSDSTVFCMHPSSLLPVHIYFLFPSASQRSSPYLINQPSISENLPFALLSTKELNLFAKIKPISVS
jgi:hypothetical protein